MTENKGLHSLLPHLLTVVGLILTITIFFSEQKSLRNLEQRNTIIMMQRQALTEQKQEFYKLADSIGSLSAILYTDDKAAQKKAFESFYIHYFGRAFLWSDKDMIKAMNLLHIDIKNYREGKISLVGNIEPKVRILRSADNVMRAMKSSIERRTEEIHKIDKKLLENIKDG